MNAHRVQIFHGAYGDYIKFALSRMVSNSISFQPKIAFSISTCVIGEASSPVGNDAQLLLVRCRAKRLRRPV